tara:strand:+ start:779 stop:1507 length:729 start_codon:yes stop_codon:yes gene_type:complete
MKSKIINGDCIEELKKIKDSSVNVVFADPPYNLSNEKFQTVKSGKYEKCDKGDWDQLDDPYEFNKKWISECIRVLKEDGTIWISGTLHNHPIVGVILKELGLWIINDIIWYKRNAPPLLSGNRFAPSTELIWLASKTKKYFFNYDLAKELNGGKQMRNMWDMTTTRHLTKHPTEKPEKLLERIINISSNEGDVILDPFLGSGTTAVVAEKMKRKYLGIEIDKEYYNISKKRLKEATNQLKIL